MSILRRRNQGVERISHTSQGQSACYLLISSPLDLETFVYMRLNTRTLWGG